MIGKVINVKKLVSPLLVIFNFILVNIIIISVSANLVLNFNFIYKRDIKTLKLNQQTSLTEEQIYNNYKAVVDYIGDKNIKELKFPDLPMSSEGKIHFEDVKALFQKLRMAILPALLIYVSLFFAYKKREKWTFFRDSALSLLIFPPLLAAAFAINFDYCFTLFHKLAFTNDYWLFDPVKDPIINLLPQEFFMHCALLILAVIILCAILLLIIQRIYYKKLNLNRN